MPYVHSVKIDRKTGKIISCEVRPTEEQPNHAPLANYLLDRMKQLGMMPNADSEVKH